MRRTPRRVTVDGRSFENYDDYPAAVFVDDGRSGSGTAGPLLERFLRSGR